jgi:exonuclease VII large subunit
MPGAAKVISIDAVERLGTALRAFRAEAGSALDDLQMEIQRGLQWIHHDCKEYWSAEVRRAEERVNQCRLQLQQAMTYRRVADHQPTCIDEKRALAAAKRRLQVAREKLEAVRHWSRVIDRAVDEYRAGRAPLAAFLEGDLPRGLALLGRMSAALGAYVAKEIPRELAAAQGAATGLPVAPAPADKEPAP